MFSTLSPHNKKGRSRLSIPLFVRLGRSRPYSCSQSSGVLGSASAILHRNYTQGSNAAHPDFDSENRVDQYALRVQPATGLQPHDVAATRDVTCPQSRSESRTTVPSRSPRVHVTHAFRSSVVTALSRLYVL